MLIPLYDKRGNKKIKRTSISLLADAAWQPVRMWNGKEKKKI